MYMNTRDYQSFRLETVTVKNQRFLLFYISN